MVELMVVIAIVAILITLAVPSVADFMTRYNLTSKSNEFLGSIRLARNEALKRGRQVDMVPLGADWTAGWVVFVDINGNNVFDAGDQQVGPITQAPGAAFTVTQGNVSSGNCMLGGGAVPFTSATGITGIAFTGGGYSTQLGTGGFLADDMRIANGAYSRCVVMNASGRVYVVGR